MNERRMNWEEALSQEAQERQQKKMALLDELETIRAELQTCGVDFQRRDAVALQYRETVAKLAAL